MTVYVLNEVVYKQENNGNTTIIFKRLYEIAKDWEVSSKLIKEWNDKDYSDFDYEIKSIFIKIGMPEMTSKYYNDFLGSKHYKNGYGYRIDSYPYKVKE